MSCVLVGSPSNTAVLQCGAVLELDLDPRWPAGSSILCSLNQEQRGCVGGTSTLPCLLLLRGPHLSVCGSALASLQGSWG